MGIKVFISYSQNDTGFATTLKSILEESSKIDAFVFEQNIRYGMQIDKKITNEIDQSDYLIAIITQNTQGISICKSGIGICIVVATMIRSPDQKNCKFL